MGYFTSNTLTVSDLLMPGKPLHSAEVVAGHDKLLNPVSWAVSLRPYPPAFPRLRGGELALVATEHLTLLDLPTTLADVVRQLASRDAAAVAVLGDIDPPAVEAARAAGLPLLRLPADAPLHDIEQAVMRVCALHQARREMMPAEDPSAWVGDLLAGRASSSVEVQSAAARQGHKLATHYAVAYVALPQSEAAGWGDKLEARLKKEGKSPSGARPVVRTWEGGLAVLLPQRSVDGVLAALAESGLPCGVGEEKPLLEAGVSLAEARLAATASDLLYGGRPARYSEMGADRLLLVLHRDHPGELEAFVGYTIGPLLRYDAEAAAPILPTLGAFLSHGGRLRETAAALYVHRNTLAYRLARAEEVLGVDLKDPQARLAVELALRALPLVGTFASLDTLRAKISRAWPKDLSVKDVIDDVRG